MPVSVRLDPKTEELVARLARKKGRTKSEVIRQAIRVLAEGQEGKKPSRPYDAISHLIGCARGGPRDLSTASLVSTEGALRSTGHRN